MTTEKTSTPQGSHLTHTEPHAAPPVMASEASASNTPAAVPFTDPLSPEVRNSISRKLQTTWEQYIDLIHRFISINTSVIVAVALTVWFLPKLRPAGAEPLVGKWLLISGLLLLLVSLMLEVIIRIWVQQFMEYEVFPPREILEKYFGDRPHYTISYRLPPASYAWQHKTVRFITKIAPVIFFVGLTFEVVFVCRNLP